MVTFGDILSIELKTIMGFFLLMHLRTHDSILKQIYKPKNMV